MTDYEPLIWKTTRRYAQGLGFELDDLAQELRIVVFRALPKHDPERSSEFGFVRMCLENHVRNLAVQYSRRPKFVDSDLEAICDDSPELAAHEQSRLDLLYREINRLPTERLRRAVRARAQGRTARQAAETMGLSHETVRQLWIRGEQIMKDRLCPM